MKKILLFVAAMTMVFAANAQNREALLSNIQKAKEATENAKKATSPSTWIKLGQAYQNAYTKVKGDAWLGAAQTEVKLVMGGQQVVSTENKTIGGNNYLIEHYADKDFYYNANGQLEIIYITNPVVSGDVLGLACDAYLKAHELDPKGSKNKELSTAFSSLRENYINDAMAEYTFGNLEKAATLFEASLKTTDNPVVNQKDSIIFFYTAVAYNQNKNTEKAKQYYNKCKEINYYQDGTVYSALADIAKAEGDTDYAKSLLNEGFSKYPTSQAILISLINLYTETKDDPNKILDLIHTAQKNEPNNASLFYAEGDIYKNLGNTDKAIEMYQKSFDMDPTYIFGMYQIGNTYFDLAVDAQTRRDALDINDYEGYEKCAKEIEDFLIKSIDPYEKAFNNAKDNDIKISIAQTLKQIFFRFRDKGESYSAGYEKYNQFLEQNNVK